MSEDTEAWRKRLNRFKLVELRQIAGHCKVPQAGKKADLINRLATYVHKQEISEAIILMGGHRQPPPTATQTNKPPQPPPTRQPQQPPAAAPPPARNNAVSERPNKRLDRRQPQSHPTAESETSRSSKRRKLDRDAPFEVDRFEACLCRGTPSNMMLGYLTEAPVRVLCTQCLNPYHSCCVHVDPRKPPPTGFLCPRCRVSDIDPFYPTVSVLHVLPLWEDYKNSVSVIAKRSLPLKSPNIQDLRRKGAEVFLFCLKLKYSGYAKLHEWPQTVNVKVNQNSERVAKPEYEHKRRDVPIRITPYLLGDTQNNIEVTATNFEVKQGQEPYSFFIALCLCERKTADQIMKSLLTTQRLPFEEARRRAMGTIGRFFGKAVNNDDDEVDMLETSCRLKLVCPITLTRIGIPVRGRSCLHFQCYDLSSFLEVTKSTKAFANRWKCVECNAFVRPNELIIDTFVEEVLRRCKPNTEAVVFAEDGSWEEQASAVPLGIGDLSDDDGGASDDGAVNAAPAAAQAIDLVELSDSDDDEALISQNPSVLNGAVVAQEPLKKAKAAPQPPVVSPTVAKAPERPPPARPPAYVEPPRGPQNRAKQNMAWARPEVPQMPAAPIAAPPPVATPVQQPVVIQPPVDRTFSGYPHSQHNDTWRMDSSRISPAAHHVPLPPPAPPAEFDMSWRRVQPPSRAAPVALEFNGAPPSASPQAPQHSYSLFYPAPPPRPPPRMEYVSAQPPQQPPPQQRWTLEWPAAAEQPPYIPPSPARAPWQQTLPPRK